MRVLVAFLLSALCCSLAEGRLMSKCEMKDLFPKLMKMKMGNVVAKIVCHAELASGFNTSMVNQLTGGDGQAGDQEAWMLYGLFQLSNHLVCSDGTTPSTNFCDMDCSNLIDDEIENDIICLEKICTHLLENGFSATDELIKMIRLIFQKECSDQTFDLYFKECA